MDSLKKKSAFISSAIIFLSGAITLYLWTSSYSSWKLREQLITLSPLSLEINFILIIIAVGLALRAFLESSRYRGIFSAIPRKTWYSLAAVILAGLVMVMFISPRVHRIYYDEDIYQNIGQNIAYTKGDGSHYSETYLQSLGSFWKRVIGRAGMCNEGKSEYGEYSCLRLEYNKEPNGWAFVLSLMYRLFGVHETVSFLTNNIIFLAAILTVFFSAYLLFDDHVAAIYAALIFSLTPQVLIWSNTVAVEPSASFFPALAVFCTLFYLKTRMPAAFFLSAVITAFAVQFRPESIMITAVIALLFLFKGRDELKKGRFYLMAAVFFILIIPHLVHLYAVKELGWGSSGPKFSFDHFEGNFKVNTLFYLRNMRFPAAFTALFLLGLFLKRKTNGSFLLPEKIVVFVWFLLFWGIFIFFYAGSYNYGADVRFSLLSAVPFSLAAGCGTSLLIARLDKNNTGFSPHYVLTTIIIGLFLSFLPFVRAVTQEAWAARADHKFAEEMAAELPRDSIVLAHNPNMFLFWGKNAAQASLATEQKSYFNRFFYRYKGGVYFHYNFWCNVSDEQQNSFCNNILKNFECTPVKSFKERNYKYVLYKVAKKGKVPKIKSEKR